MPCRPHRQLGLNTHWATVEMVDQQAHMNLCTRRQSGVLDLWLEPEPERPWGLARALSPMLFIKHFDPEAGKLRVLCLAQGLQATHQAAGSDQSVPAQRLITGP